MKQVLDVIDTLGVLFLSFTGGEPLLREDVYELIEYASDIGLIASITSNGTLEQDNYTRLLETKIDRITISLDGVEGNDFPNSHIGPQILDTITFLNAHRGDKGVRVNAVHHVQNARFIHEIVEYCEENGIPVWVQPVVTGTGKLRRHGKKVKPRAFSSRVLLNPRFFDAASKEYFEKDGLNWGCYGGELFFDVKPNGDFWICQDYATGLNILDPDFIDKWENHDFPTDRSHCDQGCIYSCYYCVQKGFEIRNFLEIMRLIWKVKGYSKYL